MSGFLANLARRGAGLPPVTPDRASEIGSRAAGLGIGNVDSAVPGSADADSETADVAQGHARIDHAPVVSVPSSPASAPEPAVRTLMAPESRPVSVGAAAHVASVPTPLVQRFVMPPTAPTPSSPSSSPAAGPVQPPTVAAAPTAPPAVPHVPSRDETRGLLRFPFAMQPAPEEPSVITPAAPAAPPTLEVERAAAPLRQPAHTIERLVTETRLVEPARSASVTPPRMSHDAGVLPSPAAPAAPPARDADMPAERVVQVRIGAIEIHGAAPAPAPAPAPPLPAAAPPLSAPGDFDRYAALRSYAAWEW